MIDVTAIIPARSGSRRFPGKNTALLNGKPLLAYAIEAWAKSKYYKHPAIVSTDDGESAAIALKYGAYRLGRPLLLAQDDTPTLAVIQHVIVNLQRYNDTRVHWIIILQPTSPLRTTEDIDKCLDIINANEADSVTSICESSKYDTKENGAIYIMHADTIAQGTLYGSRLHKYQMPEERSIDIDLPEDLEKAEKIMRGDKNVRRKK